LDGKTHFKTEPRSIRSAGNSRECEKIRRDRRRGGLTGEKGEGKKWRKGQRLVRAWVIENQGIRKSRGGGTKRKTGQSEDSRKKPKREDRKKQGWPPRRGCHRENRQRRPLALRGTSTDQNRRKQGNRELGGSVLALVRKTLPYRMGDEGRSRGRAGDGFSIRSKVTVAETSKGRVCE